MAYSGKSSINCPPKFDGLNLPIWKFKMTIFLNSLGSRVGKTIFKSFVCPEGDEGLRSEITIKEYDANSKAHYALLQALNNDISMVIHCSCAHDI